MYIVDLYGKGSGSFEESVIEVVVRAWVVSTVYAMHEECLNSPTSLAALGPY